MRTDTLDMAFDSNAQRSDAILKRWARLTIEDIEVAGDDRTLLIFAIMTRYGIGWDAAGREFANWEHNALR